MKKTIENLAKAFIGESQARNRYAMYSKIAKNEGYEQISAIFTETAEQEREHAKWLFRMINDLKKKSEENIDEIKVEASVPTVVGNTIENLKAAIAGEHYEHSDMYPSFTKTAEEEGHPDIASRLLSIAKAETHHEERYIKILREIEGGAIFKKAEEEEWFCRKCGYVHKGVSAPEKCPSCDHPQAYYQLKCEKY